LLRIREAYYQRRIPGLDKETPVEGFYLLFPETVFKLAIDAQRSSTDLIKKEVLVDDHKIVYLEGGS
jgi:hypothetical protein